MMSHLMVRAFSYGATRLRELVPSRGSAGHRQVSPEGRQLWGEPDLRPGDLAAKEVAVDRSGDVGLQDPDDVPLGPSFLHPAVEIGGGRWVVSDPDHGDAPQGAVGLTITTVVLAQVSRVLAR